MATSQSEVSKQFYETQLGLDLIEETDFALVFAANSVTVRIQKVERVFAPPYTTLGWEVENIESIVRTLVDAGVPFEHYEGMGQDNLGVWSSPGGAKVAWLKDPDGNLLSLTEPA